MLQAKGGLLAIAGIGAIVIALTLAAFFLLGIERTDVNGWALAFLLLSEIIVPTGLIGVRVAGAGHNNVLLGAGMTTTLSLYFIATLIFSLFAGSFKNELNTFILIHIAIFALFMILTISIFSWSRAAARRNAADMQKVGSNEPKRGGF